MNRETVYHYGIPSLHPLALNVLTHVLTQTNEKGMIECMVTLQPPELSALQRLLTAFPGYCTYAEIEQATGRKLDSVRPILHNLDGKVAVMGLKILAIYETGFCILPRSEQ